MKAEPTSSAVAGVGQSSTFSFITVLNPDDSSLPSYRRTVRSHAAYFHHHQETKGRTSPKLTSRKRRKIKQVALVPGESIIFTINQTPSLRSETPSPEPVHQMRTRLQDATSPKPRLAGIGQGRVDPFRSYPVAWEPFIPNLVDHYLTNMAVDLPELDEPDKPGLLRTRWFPLVMTEAATFQVIILLAASHFASLQPSRKHGPSLLQLKAKAISLIGPALAADGPTDQLIGAVAKMASYEAMFGDQVPYEEHMKGLITMVALRGGLSKLGLNGMLAKICLWVDCNSAMLHNTPLHFTDVPEHLSMQVNPSGFLAIPDAAYHVDRVLELGKVS